MKKALKILIVRGAFGEIYEPAWVRALKEQGNDVVLLDVHEILGKSLFGRIQEHLLVGPSIHAANKQLINLFNSTKPHITLLYQGHYFGSETIKTLKKNSFVVGYHNDDPFGEHGNLLKFRNLKKALPEYDGYHVYRQCNIQDFKKSGIKNVGLLMSYYIPWLDYPRTLIPNDKKIYQADILFAGHPENDSRMVCLTLAGKSNIKVRIYGYLPYWKRWLPKNAEDFISLSGPLLVDEYRRAICAAKISACFFSKWNRDQYTRRVFEIPACGGFLLAERTPIMKELYKEGKEAEYFETPEEFLDKAKYYIKHETARKRVSNAGRKRLLRSGHDIYTRMKQWLADVERWRNG